MKTILICGDRDWTDEILIAKVLFTIEDKRNTTIIHGAARGADRIAEFLAKTMKFKVVPYPADWDKYDKKDGSKNPAGPIRNRKMLKEGKPHLVIAFHDNMARSRGTKDMVTISKEAGVPVIVVDHRTNIDQLNLNVLKPAGT